MRVAIYARRSTDEHQEASLEVQLSEARRYIASKGWSVDDAHIYLEDAVSRAEFVRRPALIRLLNQAKSGAFDVVLTRDETRLGGDVMRTGLLIQDLIEKGVELWYYFTDERVKLDGATDKFMVAARNFAAELEREKISQRTREHLMVKARKGLNAGGRCYGYDNVRIEDGRVEYHINEGQAAVVRDVFQRFAAGYGYTAIAKALIEGGVSAPRAGARGTGSWSRSQIRSMLQNERYHGILIWGRHAKGYKGGTKVREKRPECEWIRIEVVGLRIIDDGLWDSVRSRMEKNRKTYGTNAPEGRPSKHLLSGLARCAQCGGPIRAETAKFGSQKVKLYLCSYARTRGSSVCENKLRRPAEEIEDTIVSWIKQNVLTEKVMVEVIREVRRRLEQRGKTAGADVDELVKQAQKLRQEVRNGAEALLKLGHSPALTEALAEREGRLKQVEAQIEATRSAPGAIDLETRRMEREARRRLKDLKALLDGNPAEGRKALEALLDGPVTFTPIEEDDGRRRYQVSGTIATGAVMAPNVNVPKGI